MAKRGSVKWFSLRQEDRVAKAYGGKRSPSSGAAVADGGDVRTERALIECKHTGTFDKPRRSISVRLSDVEKIVDEAYIEGRMPLLALSIYAPESQLANKEGCVDLTVEMTKDHAENWRDYFDE